MIIGMEHPLMRYFAYDHLPERLQPVSAPFYGLALELLKFVDVDEAEREVALRKLLEAKDAAVRSVL